jgi:ribosomal protein S18 acetylase RimI-like enzyme
VGEPVRTNRVPGYDVRMARPGDEDAICTICRQGFALSSTGLLSPATIERQAELYYNPERVRREITTAGDTPQWQGNVYVLYLDPALRGQGIGTALLGFITDQQRAAGAVEQWVSVTEGNDLGIPFYMARGFAIRERVPYVMAEDGTVEAYSLRMSRTV